MLKVYIIYSNALNKYYVGQTNDENARLEEHNTAKYKKAYTAKTNDWQLFYVINCENRTQAIKIETHIKRMKSRQYFESLKKYPEITEVLLEKYKN